MCFHVQVHVHVYMCIWRTEDNHTPAVVHLPLPCSISYRHRTHQVRLVAQQAPGTSCLYPLPALASQDTSHASIFRWIFRVDLRPSTHPFPTFPSPTELQKKTFIVSVRLLCHDVSTQTTLWVQSNSNSKYTSCGYLGLQQIY